MFRVSYGAPHDRQGGGGSKKQRMHLENPTLLIVNVQHHDLTGEVGIQDSCLKDASLMQMGA